MKRWLIACAGIVGIGVAAYGYFKEPNTFTFTVDMPPGFKYKAAVYYVPAPGETCTVARKDNLAPVFNYWWREDYKPDSVIEIRRARKGCPLVVYNIRLEIFATYGKSRGDFSSTTAQVVIKEGLDEIDIEEFNEAGESVFFGQCDWSFQTYGKTRVLRKLLDCKDVNIGRPATRGGPVAGYLPDQLPGKSIKMKITVDKEEQPSSINKWVKFPNGWKRCMGKGFEDPYAFCVEDNESFSSFILHDGTPCTIYPACKEYEGENE